MGLASRKPRQEGGSQEPEENRQGETCTMLDNSVGEMPFGEDDMGQEKCEGRLGEMDRTN